MFEKLKHRIITSLGGRVPELIPDKTDFRIIIGKKTDWVNLANADVIGASWQNNKESRFIYIFEDGSIHLSEFSEKDRPNVITTWDKLMDLKSAKD